MALFKMSAIRLFVYTELDICVHVDDMLAVGPSELTKNLFAGALERHENALGYGVTDKPQEFLGRSLCRIPQGYTFGVSCDYIRDKVVQRLWFWRTQGIQHTQFREK